MFCFFFNDTATTEIYTLSLHDALPIFILVQPLQKRRELFPDQVGCFLQGIGGQVGIAGGGRRLCMAKQCPNHRQRSEEHTSELQSRQYLVCRLLLEKKKTSQSHFIGCI